MMRAKKKSLADGQHPSTSVLKDQRCCAAIASILSLSLVFLGTVRQIGLVLLGLIVKSMTDFLRGRMWLPRRKLFCAQTEKLGVILMWLGCFIWVKYIPSIKCY